MRHFVTGILASLLLLPLTTRAEIVSSSETHFTLRHEATSPLSPERLWEKLIRPASWWHPDHSYSGDAGNLSLDAQAGGLWREDWDGGSVSHGRVLLVIPGKTLRLEAPFGPLQGLGAYTVWTISIAAGDGGSVVVFDEVATGPSTAKLAEVAGAVDFVKSEAIRRLVAEKPGG